MSRKSSWHFELSRKGSCVSGLNEDLEAVDYDELETRQLKRRSSKGSNDERKDNEGFLKPSPIMRGADMKGSPVIPTAMLKKPKWIDDLKN